MRRFLMGLLLVPVIAIQANAASIVNGGFESNTFGSGGKIGLGGSFTLLGTGSQYQGIDGWTVIKSPTNANVTNPNTALVKYVAEPGWDDAEGALGSHSLDLNVNATGGGGGVQQVVTGLIAGTFYSVTFQMSGNPLTTRGVKPLTVDILGGASDTYTYNTATELNTKTNMKYVTQTFTFLAGSASETLRFYSTSNTLAGGPVIDNVSIAAVPLPASLGLLLAGLPGFAGFGWVLRRKNSNRQA